MNSEKGKTITGNNGSFRRFYVWFAIMILATATLITCEKPERQVLISVLEAIDADISYTSVTLKGNIEDLGSAPIDDYGILASVNGTPEPGNSTVKSLGKPSAKGGFEAKIENLTSNTKYYFRAYVTVKGAKVYSEQTKQFTTKAYSLPTVTTTDVTSVTSSSGISGGNVTADGGASITARGVCWSASANPTTADTKTTDGSGTGTFTSNIAGLTENTTYHARAYATNVAGTAYGSDVTFTTIFTVVVPVVSTLSVTSIGTTSATGGGSVSDAGHGTVTARGVCWAQYPNPVTADYTTVNGEGTGSFLSSMTNLTPSTTYHVRAYAINSAGTGYGTDVSFTTNSAIIVPTLTTSAVLSITSSSAISGGNITSDGGGTVTSKGVCWSTAVNPTVNDTKSIDGTGTASFSSSLTGLNAGTMYHVRAYATNSAGTGYGEDLTFTTLITTYVPTVVTGSVSALGTTTATCGGTVNDDGGASVTEKGVCYGINANPTILDSKTSNGTGTGSFVSNLTGLTPSTTYHLRAYATNSKGTGYGTDITFTTNAEAALPTVTTTAITGITKSGASSGGNVTSEGEATVTKRGVCWSTSPNPVATGNSTDNGSGSGTFTSTITGANSNTLYYVRAYATNSTGTAYGSELQFTTLCNSPVVNTSAASGITYTTAKLNGIINADNISTIPFFQYGTTTSYGSTLNTTPYSVDGAINTAVSSDIINLTPGTLYHYRIVAIFCGVDVYGTDQTFTTTVVGTPSIATNSISGISATGAISGGEITSDGGASVTERGVCWSTLANPTTADSKTSSGTGIGTFISSIAGLNPGTLYHVRAYATNTAGTSYGADVQFMTSITSPTLTTTAVSDITSTTASSGGNITSDGGSAITARGVCWNTISGPTISNQKTTDGSGSGSFTSNITGLTPSTKYYVRAYATNSEGTSYGNEIDFTTTLSLATLTTTVITALSTTSATSGGEITSDGGSAVTDRGVCWSTTANPTTADFITNNGSGTGVFTSSITGLSANTTYHLRAYATTLHGTSYGSDLTFTTTILLSDIDGNTYNTVSIGTQLWMKENLKTTKYRDGTSIPNVTDNAAWANLISGAYCNFNNDPGYVSAYGRLYNYYANVDNHNLCPTGWHIPTAGEWTTLANYLGGSSVAGGKLKEAGTINWGAPNEGADNSSGFTAIPAPTRFSDGTFSGGGYICAFWVPLETDANNANYKYMNYAEASLNNNVYLKTQGYQVRCLQGEGQVLAAVTTTAISDVAVTTASSGGNVTSDGGATVTSRGVCWNTSANPTKSNSKTTDGSGTGIFTSSIAGLIENTTYHVRAYATNSIGTAYGSDISFTTVLVSSVPTVTTTALSSITGSTAASGGNITSDGGAAVSSRGVCWSTSLNPTISDPKTVDGTGSGTFTSNITGLTGNTVYHVRAYATNVAGTAYGSDLQFTTSSPTFATVTTAPVTGIFSLGATSGGDITSEGGASVTARGVCWSTSPNPTTSNSKTVNGTGAGTFASTLTALSANTFYYVRAYATNSVGTAYGDQVSFTSTIQVTDYDGNTYNTVQIGTQLWLQENLKVTHYRNGNTIPEVTDDAAWNALTSGAYCNYNNEVGYVTTYGRLYNYYAATDSRNLCPTGWHVSSYDEWFTTLANYLGGENIAGGKLKEAGTTHWVQNIGATNSSAFTGLPGGMRYQGAWSGDIGSMYGYFMTSTEYDYDPTQVMSAVLGYYDNRLQYGIFGKSDGLSVRCVKD